MLIGMFKLPTEFPSIVSQKLTSSLFGAMAIAGFPNIHKIPRTIAIVAPTIFFLTIHLKTNWVGGQESQYNHYNRQYRD